MLFREAAEEVVAELLADEPGFETLLTVAPLDGGIDRHASSSSLA